MLTQANVAKTFGIVLLLVGILGFIPNPIVGDLGASGDDAIFGANALHNVVHLLSGLVALSAAYLTDKPQEHSRLFNLGFGGVYAVVTLVGFVLPDLMLDLLAINTADNVLHLLIAVVLLGVGFAVDVDEHPM